MIRPLILSLTYPRSTKDDLSIFVRELVREYSDLGIKGQVVVPLDNNEPTKEKEGSFTVDRFRYGIFSRGSLAYGAGLAVNLRRHPILWLQMPMLFFQFLKHVFAARVNSDVMHAIGLPAGVVAAVMNFLTRKPYVLTLLEADQDLRGNAFFDSVFKISIQRAAAVVAETVVAKGIFSDWLKDEVAVQIVPRSIPDTPLSQGMVDTYAASRKLDSYSPFLLAVNAVEESSGLEFLISLLKNEKLSRYSLIVTGEVIDKGHHASLKAQIEEEGSSGRVLFTGNLPAGELLYYCRLARAYVSAAEHPTEYYLLLSMFNGLPAAVTSHPVHDAHVTDRQNGYLFAAGDKEAAINAVLEAAEGVQRTGIRDLGRQYARQFSGEATARRYLTLFGKVAPSGSRKSA